MPQVPRNFSAYPVSVTLDANGDGAVRFQAVGSNIRVSNLSVRVSSATNQATATMYKNQIGEGYRLSGTNSGSTGDNVSIPVDLFDGEAVIVVWEGGDAGATATATFSGKQLPFDQVGTGEGGTNWSSPIAAGDGSLVYPALKSPNFVTGVAGWQISRDGSVEFVNGTFRGDVQIIGASRIISITGNSGVKIEDLTAPGAFAQITTAPAFGGLVNLQPADSSIPGTSFDPARLYANASEGFGDSQPYLQIESPVIAGAPDLDKSAIQLAGQSKLSADDDSYISLTADQIASSVGNNSRFVGSGWWTGETTTGASGAIGATETAVLTVPSFTYRRGHTYKAEIICEFSCANAAVPPLSRPLFRLRENWVSSASPGLQVRSTGKPAITNGSQHNGDFSVIFNVGATDVTAPLTLTAVGSGAFTVTVLSASIDIYDIGSTQDHPNAVVIT